MPESRNWDGSPETSTDTRFYDLREAGYTGPFNWDTAAPETDPQILAIFDRLDQATTAATEADTTDGQSDEF